MRKINWKVRFKNGFWLSTLTAQTALLIQGVVAGLVSLDIVSIDLEQLDESIKVVLGIVNSGLLYLSFLGIISDPTTKGYGDSEQAQNYHEPN